VELLEAGRIVFGGFEYIKTRLVIGTIVLHRALLCGRIKAEGQQNDRKEM
jgi:hypothetical protein